MLELMKKPREIPPKYTVYPDNRPDTYIKWRYALNLSEIDAQHYLETGIENKLIAEPQPLKKNK